MNPKNLKAIDFKGAVKTLWLFKQPQKAEDGRPKYKGRWLDIDQSVGEKLSEAASITCSKIDEIKNFSLLGSTNDGMALSIPADETNADLVQAQTSEELPDNKISKVKEILNSKFYVAKFVKDESVILACKKLDSSWSTKKSNSFIPAAFTEATLTLAPQDTFQLPRDFDFFILDGVVIISKKDSFESVLSYKQAHLQDFEDLLKEDEFNSCFSDINPIKSFVGSNKLLLRRACAVREKRHYANASFMQNFRARHKVYKLNVNFDANGKIVPCDVTCRDIFNALLDHRLKSGFSENVYEVTDATPA